MLSKAQMVAARKVIEMTYDGVCSITEQQKVEKENRSTSFLEVVVVENQPCRLSYTRISNTTTTHGGANVMLISKIFIAPEVKVKPGSKLIVTQNGVTTAYQNSGEPAIYLTHQEIILELFERWA